MGVIIILIIVIVIVVAVMISKYYGNANTEEGMAKIAERKLRSNPDDTASLLISARTAFKKKDYPKAINRFKSLEGQLSSNPTLPKTDIMKHLGLSYYYMKDNLKAFQCLIQAQENSQLTDYLVTKTLGMIYYKRKDYKHAAGQFAKVALMKPHDTKNTLLLGLSFYRIGNFAEAISKLQSILEFFPDNENAFYALAQSYRSIGEKEKAVETFQLMRSMSLAPVALFEAGEILMDDEKKSAEGAALLEESLEMQNNIKTPQDVKLQTLYRLAEYNFQKRDIDKSYSYLVDIIEITDEFKDVKSFYEVVKEFHDNKLYFHYLYSDESRALPICRRIVFASQNKGTKEIISEFSDSSCISILIKVKEPKWEEIIYFKLFRDTRLRGEEDLRICYNEMKERVAGKGLCVSPGGFDSNSKEFSKARMIELQDKEYLLKLLNRINERK